MQRDTMGPGLCLLNTTPQRYCWEWVVSRLMPHCGRHLPNSTLFVQNKTIAVPRIVLRPEVLYSATSRMAFWVTAVVVKYLRSGWGVLYWPQYHPPKNNNTAPSGDSLFLPSAPLLSDWTVSFKALFIGSINIGRWGVEKEEATEVDHFQGETRVVSISTQFLHPRKCWLALNRERKRERAPHTVGAKSTSNWQNQELNLKEPDAAFLHKPTVLEERRQNVKCFCSWCRWGPMCWFTLNPWMQTGGKLTRRLCTQLMPATSEWSLFNYAMLSSFNISNQILHFSIVFLFLINIITADNLTMAQRKLADFISTNLSLYYKYILHKSQIILLLYRPSAVLLLHLLHPSAKSNVFPNSQPMPFN